MNLFEKLTAKAAKALLDKAFATGLIFVATLVVASVMSLMMAAKGNSNQV